MSRCSIAPYFPWRRMKVAHQSVSAESRSTLISLEPNKRHHPTCYICERPAQAVHSANLPCICSERQNQHPDNITPVSGGRSSLSGPGCTKVV